jgi:hypothetical protein
MNTIDGVMVGFIYGSHGARSFSYLLLVIFFEAFGTFP